ncbi:NAD-dependent epimerase/dehydratase family protein [Rhizorhapis sp.]|uniref:NAD-dependent epimerase/dehydratase family protein n=1 Tax=Rhizorhapis sp. TaxID=1968842 RepID=UPI002B46BA1F|nr:NAD(P)H-binding protein [Rhizorhapis sp.]HKR17579.1 NAD(P)H-binding protein [Rhizorhapis sp.]
MPASPLPLRLAITGGTGFVGRTVVTLACAQNLTLNALTRRPQDVCAGVTWIEGALDRDERLADLMADADAVLHIAGVVNAPDRAGFKMGNAAGTLAVVRAARRAGVCRFIHVSSLSAREPQLSHYGWSKRRAEQIVMASGLDWTIIRPPAIYGPGDTELLELFRLARRGLVLLPPKGRLSVIEVSDLARLLLACAQDEEESIGAIYEADDGLEGGWSHQSFGRAIGSAVGRRVATLSTPRALLHLAARADGMLRGTKAKLTADRVSYFCHPDWVVDPAKRPPSWLWEPQVGTRAGLKNAAEWYREQGWLK